MHIPKGGERPDEANRTTSDPDAQLPRRSGRVHISARQRGADVTALGRLVLHLPQVLGSLSVVFVLSHVLDILCGLPWWISMGCWALSGALIFSRPCERVVARRLFHLRHPGPDERRRLRSAWGEVTARAGVDRGAYQLWVQESSEVNAMAAAGHIVSVTSHSLAVLPPAQLAGVLAHELGHHTQGHAWASLLSYWYSLPGRLAWRVLLHAAARLRRPALSGGAAALTVGLLVIVAVLLARATYGLVFLPFITPYLAAAVSRRSELRADAHAAGLGFAAQLMSVLGEEYDGEESARAGPATADGTDGMFVRLLDSHPDVHTRLHHLQNLLDETRRR